MGEARHHLKFRVAEGGSSGELLIVACAERSARVFLRISVVRRALGLCARLTSTGGNADEGEDQGMGMPDQISVWRVIWEACMRRPFATVLVGPSALLREGLTRILGAADFRIIASSSTVDDAVLTALARHRSVLLVVESGDDLSGAVRQVELFKERHPEGRVAVLADHNQPSDILSAFRAGAHAYFMKVAPC